MGKVTDREVTRGDNSESCGDSYPFFPGDLQLDLLLPQLLPLAVVPAEGSPLLLDLLLPGRLRENALIKTCAGRAVGGGLFALNQKQICAELPMTLACPGLALALQQVRSRSEMIS